MKATTKEEADKAWIEKSNAYFREIKFDSSACIQTNYLDGISDFKSALRAEIEKKQSDGLGFLWTIRELVDLLETTLPPKE